MHRVNASASLFAEIPVNINKIPAVGQNVLRQFFRKTNIAENNLKPRLPVVKIYIKLTGKVNNIAGKILVNKRACAESNCFNNSAAAFRKYAAMLSVRQGFYVQNPCAEQCKHRNMISCAVRGKQSRFLHICRINIIY